MPEISEENVFREWLEFFRTEAGRKLPPGALKVVGIWADVKDSETKDMAKREERLMLFATTLSMEMLRLDFHRAWAVRLERLAEAVPDTHGQLISKVCEKFPEAIRSQICDRHTSWSDFCKAICDLKFGVITKPAELPTAWFKEPTVGNLQYDLPSTSQLVVKLNRYMPPTWRGPDPDRRFTTNRPPPKDNEWEDPIPLPQSAVDPNNSPRSLWHPEHGDVLGSVAPPSLANPGISKVKKRRGKKALAKERDVASNQRLTNFFTFTPGANPGAKRAIPRTVAGVSTKLDSMGVKKAKKTVEQCTESDIDHSLYLWPSYLFPDLDDLELPQAAIFDKLDLELVGLEYDPRDIILDLKQCYLEIEPLLHTSPQIFKAEVKAEDREGVTRIPAKKRGFKVVMALELVTHTIAWLSSDNNCHVYWFSREDMELARPERVPDVLLNYRKWCEYVVKWLKKQDQSPTLDSHSVSDVLSAAGNHPLRAVGRYSLDEIVTRSGIPLWTLWRTVRLNPAKLAAVLETYWLFVWERYAARWEFLGESKKLNELLGSDSFLLITTKDSIYKNARYNRLSIRSYKDDSESDIMNGAPWTFDLAELAPAVLLSGHMGPLIVGQEGWNDLYNKQAADATTKEMRALFRNRLPASLSEVQKLAFKPSVDITDADRAVLFAEYGEDDVNPVIRYFEQKTITNPFWMHVAPLRLRKKKKNVSAEEEVDTMHVDEGGSSLIPLEEGWFVEDEEENDIFMGPLPVLTDTDTDSSDDDAVADSDPGYEYEEAEDVDPTLEVEVGEDVDANECLTLIRDPKRRKIQTRLVDSVDGPAWTVLKPPKFTTQENDAHTPSNALVFVQKVNAVRTKKTLREIKHTRLYTVGPLDFCGHAKALQVGRGWLIAPCHWHPRLSDEDQLREMAAWETIGTWKKGVAKLSKKAMGTELRLRAKVRKELKKVWWKFTRPLTEDNVVRETRRQKAVKLAKKRARELKALEATLDSEGLMKIDVDMPLDMNKPFKSERLNNIAGEDGREELRGRASTLLGIKKQRGKNV
ncbi:hypothetical protein C8R44DRAFT_885796 [Mycena epipterygia]|nr:hypothetical protein C8R44DRAFT_885796 [Mycena epipterygia]